MRVGLASMREQFPPLEPFKSGILDVGDGHSIYWECCGNPSGIPALFLHGGLGAGCSPGQRRFFDPKRHCAMLFDQLATGRSRPLASSEPVDLTTNTTAYLISDIETLRAMLGIEKWIILGLSWGTTLGLAYAQRHVARVRAKCWGLLRRRPGARCNGLPKTSGAYFIVSGRSSSMRFRSGCARSGLSMRTPPCSRGRIPPFAIRPPVRLEPTRPERVAEEVDRVHLMDFTAIFVLQALKCLRIGNRNRAWRSARPDFSAIGCAAPPPPSNRPAGPRSDGHRSRLGFRPPAELPPPGRRPA